jgi:hypothetical protein
MSSYGLTRMRLVNPARGAEVAPPLTCRHGKKVPPWTRGSRIACQPRMQPRSWTLRDNKRGSPATPAPAFATINRRDIKPVAAPTA